MNNTNAAGNYYTIGHIVQFTGLTDRTIRNYISLGLLEGEKINGLWHFSPEQAEAFVRNPAVRPSILAKQNGKVFDFLLDTKKPEPRACIILDLPGEDPKTVSEYFCYSISNGPYRNFQFSFDAVNSTPRVILSGSTEDVLKLVNGYYASRK